MHCEFKGPRQSIKSDLFEWRPAEWWEQLFIGLVLCFSVSLVKAQDDENKTKVLYVNKVDKEQ